MTQNNKAPRRMGGHGMRGTGEKARDFGGTIKQLMKTLRPYSVMMFFGILFAAAATALTVLGPRVLGKATTALAEGFLAKATGTGSIDFPLFSELADERGGAEGFLQPAPGAGGKD